jgi:hypothetical protein
MTCYPTDETIAGRCLPERRDYDDVLEVTKHLSALYICTCDFMKILCLEHLVPEAIGHVLAGFGVKLLFAI